MDEEHRVFERHVQAVANEQVNKTQRQKRTDMQHGTGYSSNNAGDGPGKRQRDSESKNDRPGRHQIAQERHERLHQEVEVLFGRLRELNENEPTSGVFTNIESLIDLQPEVTTDSNTVSVPVRILPAPPSLEEVPENDSPSVDDSNNEDAKREPSDLEWEEEIKIAAEQQGSSSETDDNDLSPSSPRPTQSEEDRPSRINRAQRRMQASDPDYCAEADERKFSWQADVSRTINNRPGTPLESWEQQYTAAALIDGDRIIDHVHRTHETIGNAFMSIRRMNDRTMQQITGLLPIHYLRLIQHVLDSQHEQIGETQHLIEEQLNASTSVIHSLVRHARMPTNANCRVMAESLGISITRRAGRSHAAFMRSFASINNLRVHPSIAAAVQPPRALSVPFDTWSSENTSTALRYAEAAIIGLGAYRIHHPTCARLLHRADSMPEGVHLYSNRVYVLSVQAAMSRGIVPMPTHNARGTPIQSCCGDLWSTAI